ncbi:Uu.00g022520.m01.CDS01, partial [Anthostomella pinea]
MLYEQVRIFDREITGFAQTIVSDLTTRLLVNSLSFEFRLRGTDDPNKADPDRRRKVSKTQWNYAHCLREILSLFALNKTADAVAQVTASIHMYIGHGGANILVQDPQNVMFENHARNPEDMAAILLFVLPKLEFLRIKLDPIWDESESGTEGIAGGLDGAVQQGNAVLSSVEDLRIKDSGAFFGDLSHRVYRHPKDYNEWREIGHGFVDAWEDDHEDDDDNDDDDDDVESTVRTRLDNVLGTVDLREFGQLKKAAFLITDFVGWALDRRGCKKPPPPPISHMVPSTIQEITLRYDDMFGMNYVTMELITFDELEFRPIEALIMEVGEPYIAGDLHIEATRVPCLKKI